MNDVDFIKMSAGGNDFILIDNWTDQFPVPSSQFPTFVGEACQRKRSIGADGVLLLEGSKSCDIKMRVFNPDGSEVEMCGNGARCVALYVARWSKSKIKNQKSKIEIETMAGILEAEVVSSNRVRLKMGDPTNPRLDFNLLVDNREYKVHSINTGVSHIILFVEDLEKAEVKELGKKIRYHQEFAPEGTNVNFIKIRDGHSLDIRTYERGVEDETLACGTGAAASAIISHLLGRTKSPTKMYTKSSSILTIYFDSSPSKITNLSLEGDAAVIYEGEL